MSAGLGYGSKPPGFQGIYTCTYSDAAAIPEADLGYAAIAQALGMVREAIQGGPDSHPGRAGHHALPPAGAAGSKRGRLDEPAG